MSDTEDDLDAYWSLVVTTCEWRAFGVDDPEAMATRVFARLRAASATRHPRPGTLRALYAAVEEVVTEAYRLSAGRGPWLVGLVTGVGSAAWRAPDDPQQPYRRVLAGLRTADRVVLQQRLWDDLTWDEIAELSPARAAPAADRYAVALGRFARGLPPGVGDPETVMRDLHPGEHRRWDRGWERHGDCHPHIG